MRPVHTPNLQVHRSGLSRETCTSIRQTTTLVTLTGTPPWQAPAAGLWANFTAWPGGHNPDLILKMEKLRPREVRQSREIAQPSRGEGRLEPGHRPSRPILYPPTPPTGPQTHFSEPSCPSSRLGCGAIFSDSNRLEKSDTRKEPDYRLFLEGRGACGGPGARLWQPGSQPSPGQGRAGGTDQPGRARGFPPDQWRRQRGQAICPSTCLSTTGTDSPQRPGAPLLRASRVQAHYLELCA